MNSRVVCRDSDNGVVPRERWARALLRVVRWYSAASGGGAGRRHAAQRYDSEFSAKSFSTYVRRSNSFNGIIYYYFSPNKENI